MYSSASTATQAPTSIASSLSGMPAAAAAAASVGPVAAIRLHGEEKWHQFHQHTNEMIVTKHGRRLFPHLAFSVTGLSPDKFYSCWITMERVDRRHYKYTDANWSAAYCKDESQEDSAVGSYVHPESPKTGSEWMSDDLSFEKLKITNSSPPVDGPLICLKTMKKYIPMVHIADVSNPRIVFCHAFQETSFIAVTAYQNTDITRLKIQYNKFAKGQKVELSSSYGSTGEEPNQTNSDLSTTFSSPEQPQQNFNFSSPEDTAFNSPFASSNRYWNSSPLTPDLNTHHLRQHSSPCDYGEVYSNYSPHSSPCDYGEVYSTYSPHSSPCDYGEVYSSYSPQSYAPSNVVPYQLPHSNVGNDYHYPQHQHHQYVHRQNNSSTHGQYHPYRRPASYTWNS